MRQILRFIAVGALAASILACASPSPPASPPSEIPESASSEPQATPESIALHLKCLLTEGVTERIEACTSAINSGSLPPKTLANALAMRGAMFLRQQRPDDARIDFEEAKRLAPEDPQIDEGLALVERSKARTSPEKLAQVQAAFDCLDLADAASRLAACDRFVEQTVGRPRDQALAYDARAFVKLGQRDTAGALEDLDEAAMLAPDSSEIQEHRLWALFMHGGYRAALPGLEERLAADPYNDVLKSMVATIYYVEGDKQRALGEFDAMRLWERRESLPASRSVVIRLEQQVSQNPFEDLKWRPAQLWLGVLVRYRMSEISEEEFRADMPIFVPTEDGFDACLTEFHVAHKAALAGETDPALLGFGKAINVCGIGEFEYHAAKAWLRELGR